jgi:adenine-specific DNA-methyltransferase
MSKRVEANRVVVDSELSYVMRSPCLVVQRTANRNQKRRINAAMVDQTFFAKNGCFVAENHVIVLTPPENSTAKDLRDMVRLLNSPHMTALYDRSSGTANVSIETLMNMKLPVTA